MWDAIGKQRVSGGRHELYRLPGSRDEIPSAVLRASGPEPGTWIR